MKTLDLNGTWQVRWTDGQRGKWAFASRDNTDPARYIEATVPGSIHADLLRQGLIPDPNLGMNVLACRWVEEMIWSYRRTFEAPDGAQAGRAWLVFEGLDINARIHLNGKEIARHCNAFYPLRVEVTDKLRTGTNVLAVHLDSGLYAVADRPIAGYMRHHDDLLLHKRVWLRKPQSQFSWDWAPRLINVGMYGPVRLEWTDHGIRTDQLVPLATVSDDLKQGTVCARWFVEGLTDTPVAGRLTAELSAGCRAWADVEIRPGLHPVEVTLTVDDPALWWPVGQGDPTLHTLQVTLEVGGTIMDRRTVQIGFRHVRFVQSPHPESGQYFHLEINGRKIFAKGANLVPNDLILTNCTRDRYAMLVDLALEQNFNFLRVWGGGVYEADDFYDLCNQKGILVWQEFIYACDKFPTHDQSFHDDAKREAVYQIRRLAKHPSLIAWCGNNEIETANWDPWIGMNTGQIMPDYGFYHLTLPRLVSEQDPTRYYQPSSPLSPGVNNPLRDDMGDQHPWTIGFLDTDFRGYRRMVCRFANEGGTLGASSLPTMLACLPEGQRYVQSLAWQVHDNGVDTWFEPSTIDAMTEQWLGKDARRMTIEQYTYWGGLLKAEGLKEYCDNFRRRMFDSGAAVFWMFNDVWPAVRSWTTVDYYLRRTPAFHPVRRAMAPVHVVVAEEGDQVVVFGINDTQQTVRGELRYGIFELAGRYLMDQRQVVELPPNASTALARFPIRDWTDPSRSAAFAVLSRDGAVLARNRLLLPLFKDIRWPAAEVSWHRDGDQVTFTSDSFVLGVCLDLDGGELPADNFFDLFPGMPHTIPWPAQDPPRVLFTGNLDHPPAAGE